MSYQNPPDVTTVVGQIRFLIGDIAPTPNFQDETLQFFYNQTAIMDSGPKGSGGQGSLFLACALAMDALASMAGQNFQSVTIGDFTTSDADKVTALQAQADRFRELEFNTPAFAVVEQNLSQMNELIIIRNWILRTEM